MISLFRIVLLFALAALQPFLWGYVSDRAQQLHLLQTNEEQFALLSQKMIESQQAFSDAQPRLLKLGDVFPASSALSQVVGRIEALADTKQLGIELKSIEDTISIEAGSGTIRPKRITAEVTGSVEALFSFLEAMENQNEFLSIESWDIIAAGLPEKASQPVFQMTLHTIYYFYDAPI
ncbi:MAG: hypothetical protein A3C02_04040 [Candidatus Andersenbacteria bacterium RIFCSPHIGHO2_02_FULL_45_11]|uniref:Uncharacterized protein n=1 Tax=Candidatus Andersenbacteria bacterium RIFCSPHIGHO2_12_FULL_45_11 TaxID=1797281 RepID=A0A1G1X0J6_9BACT|nr:MAG: hypothetical protein A2805_00755 [Candidatus Andersenbacteria bacterium RIFCSPHIGHO2_01_FULL_46_36]OGY33080.1 MAG: hypothetical protein A3D99_01325 [Candidatus Andersenbacteria bacterium RIFCSPHIGHO2_12_FULL_45_11]OGY33400.1 MAG: hypothetical protein A3C02_04040 [Candidatus Andersenbacteria bacterium RIFCSPHIGHO2_02_FULL_45_11]